MNPYLRGLLIVCVPALLTICGTLAYLDYSGWAAENENVAPLPKPSTVTPKKVAGGGCCCAAKGKKCSCGDNCGSHQKAVVSQSVPVGAAATVGLLGSPMGALNAACGLAAAATPPAKAESGGPAARSTPAP